MNAADLRRLLECDRPSCACHKARGTNTHCPSHEDSEPSLSITDGTTAVLFKCFRGCESTAIVEALKARGLWDVKEKVTPIRGNEPIAVYRYMDADGNLVGEKGRFESYAEGKRSKTFLWRLPGETKWGGLNGLGMEHMPLYNLSAVLEHPDATVIVVEGEKAAQALITRGAVAVCLAGGASQQRFGNSLDVLQGRDVILWPDNDEAGQGLMARIASYLPQAVFVRPVVPEKGDAWDYFEGGGSLDALKALLQTGEPTVTVEGANAVTVRVPVAGGEVRVSFTEMVASARTLEAGMEVKANVPGLIRVPYRSRVNMLSQSAISGHVTGLNGFYGTDARAKDGIRWMNVLMTACSMASEAWKGIDRSILMADVELVEVREWLVDGLVPLNLVTIPFGMGGGGKSVTFGIHLSLHALLGRPWNGLPMRQVDSVLIVDYEDTQEEWRLRFQEVGLGMGLAQEEIVMLMESIRWLPGNGIPLVDQAEVVRKLVAEHHVGLLIVDSCISAVGGDLMDTVAAQRLVNWQTALGRDSYVTTVMLAHNPKTESKEQTLYPYGNIFFHNLPRSTVYIESRQEEGSRIMDVVLRQRKASRGRIRPIPLRLTFPEVDGGAITFEHLDRIPEDMVPEAARIVRHLKDEVRDALLGGMKTIPMLRQAVGGTDDSIRGVLINNPSLFRIVRRDGRVHWWGVTEERTEAAF